MNLHQHAKNQGFSSSCSRDIVDLKILRSDWLRAFWPIAQEPDFSQIQDLCKNTANINFHYTPNSEKLMNKFSVSLKNPIFSPFSQSFGQNFFSKKNLAVTHSSIWAPKTTLSFKKKTNDPIPRKHPDRMEGWKDERTEGWKDRQPLIHRNLPATARGPTNFSKKYKRRGALHNEKQDGWPTLLKVAPKFSKMLSFSENLLCKLKIFCDLLFLRGFMASNGNIIIYLIKKVFVLRRGLLQTSPCIVILIL